MIKTHVVSRPWAFNQIFQPLFQLPFELISLVGSGGTDESKLLKMNCLLTLYTNQPHKNTNLLQIAAG